MGYVQTTSKVSYWVYSNIAFSADNCLSKSNWILCWLLPIVCWIIVLTIARSYLTKVVFYTILIDNGWPNAWMWKILEFYFYQGMEAKAHWLYIEPQFTRDKGWIVIWALLSPIQHKRIKTVQLFQPDVPDVS